MRNDYDRELRKKLRYKPGSLDAAVATKTCRRVLQSHRPRVRRSSDRLACNAALSAALADHRTELNAPCDLMLDIVPTCEYAASLAYLSEAPAAASPHQDSPCVSRGCKATKPLAEFQASTRNADKHLARCKTCRNGAGYAHDRHKTVVEKVCRCVLQSRKPRVRRSGDRTCCNAAPS